MPFLDDLLEPSTAVPRLRGVRPMPEGVDPVARRRRARDADRGRLRLVRVPGVYAPSTDSRLLVDALASEPLAGARMLDLCTGSGFVAVSAARAGAEVVAVDVGRRAVLAARLNLWRNRTRGQVRRGDLLSAAPTGDYDLIVSNPPYVPAARDELPTRGIARAWDGGRDGRAIIDRICREAPSRLRPGGRLLLVQSAVADPDRTLEALRGAGLRAGVARECALPFGPVMRRRATLLGDAGLIASGQRHERLIVIRATAEG